MIERISVPWPVPATRPEDPSGAEPRLPRILAVSDMVEPALEHERNRAQLGRIDLVIGAGDLEPGYLALLGDAFRVPLLYVRGNHDRGLGWSAHESQLPEPLADARAQRICGLEIVGLSWPGRERGRAERDDGAAWGQTLKLGSRLVGRRRADIVISHVPPAGCGDDPTDPYHRGFAAYRWLIGRLAPRLWLHGHTTVATVRSRVITERTTTLVNVTGATLLELVPAA
jgi:hypothetical protein